MSENQDGASDIAIAVPSEATVIAVFAHPAKNAEALMAMIANVFSAPASSLMMHLQSLEFGLLMVPPPLATRFGKGLSAPRCSRTTTPV